MNNYEQNNRQFYAYENPTHTQAGPGFRQERVSGLAVASLIFGILALTASTRLAIIMNTTFLLVMGLIAVLLSISPIRKNARGKGMAIAGLILGIIAVARVMIFWGQIESLM